MSERDLLRVLMEDAELRRYDHGGARLAILRDGERELIADFYGNGEWREFFMDLVQAESKRRSAQETEGCRYPMSGGRRCDQYPNCECGPSAETLTVPPGHFWRGEPESNRHQCRNCGEHYDKHLHTDEASTCPTAETRSEPDNSGVCPVCGWPVGHCNIGCTASSHQRIKIGDRVRPAIGTNTMLPTDGWTVYKLPSHEWRSYGLKHDNGGDMSINAEYVVPV